jgi:hypothetical protein
LRSRSGAEDWEAVIRARSVCRTNLKQEKRISGVSLAAEDVEGSE